MILGYVVSSVFCFQLGNIQYSYLLLFFSLLYDILFLIFLSVCLIPLLVHSIALSTDALCLLSPVWCDETHLICSGQLLSQDATGQAEGKLLDISFIREVLVDSLDISFVREVLVDLLDISFVREVLVDSLDISFDREVLVDSLGSSG